MNTTDLLKFHEDICLKSREIMRAKNSDYSGSSGTTPFANFETCQHLGLCTTEQGMLMRITDKLMRLSTFVKDGKLSVANESATDACEDIINYVILFAAYQQHKQEQQTTRTTNE